MDYPHLGQPCGRPDRGTPLADVRLGLDQHVYEQHRHRPVRQRRDPLQAWCSLAAAELNLALSIYWVQRIGAPGVILRTIVSYLVVLVGPQTWACTRVLKGQV
jgi:hypothetical protein